MAKISLRMADENGVAPPMNPCGDCTACCHVLAIAELGKPVWQNCLFQNSSIDKTFPKEKQLCIGCSIYNTKPQECSDYWCFFSGGMFGKDISYRPDKLGLIIDFRGAEETERLPVQFLQVWETRPNALKEKRAKEMIEYLSTNLKKRFPLVIRKFRLPLSKIQIYGSTRDIQQITSFLLKDLKESRRQEK